MAKDREEVKLAFQVELESRKALQGLALIDKGLRQVTKGKNKSIKWDDKKGFGDFKKRFGDYRKSIKTNEKELKALGKILKEVGGGKHGNNFNKAMRNFGVEHQKFTTRVVAAEKKMAQEVKTSDALMRHATTKEAKEAIQEQLKEKEKQYQKEVNLARVALNRSRAAIQRAATGPGKAQIMEKHAEQVEQRQKAAKEFSEAIEDIKTHSMGKDMAEGFTDGLSNLAGKDLLGVAKSGVGLSASLFKGAGKLGMKWGRDLQIAGAGKGGAGGAAMGAMGGMMKGIGPLVATLSKLGPILAGVVGIFGAIFKLMSAIEGAAKDMNKQLLEGSAMAGVLAKNAGRSDKAFKEVSDTLQNIRDYASSGEALDVGMKKDDILQMTSSLMQEGLTIDRMNDAFARVKETAKGAVSEIKDFGNMARMGFAYSKLFGVSMQEVGVLQAEMIQELGSSVKTLTLDFARMGKDAGDSGLAANKFFSIIRSVSSDLALYNTRLDQASTILKGLGKVMNSRDAEKFMQSMSQGLTSMDLMTRTRTVAIAGKGNVSAMAKEDTAGKTDHLIQEIAANTKTGISDITAAFAKYRAGDAKALNAILDKAGPEQGALAKSAQELSRMANLLDAGDMVSIAEAIGSASAGAQMGILKASMLRLVNMKKGGKDKVTSLSDIKGNDLVAVTTQFGDDTLKQLRNMESNMVKQRGDMQSALEHTLPDKDKQLELIEDMAKAGVTTVDQLKALSDSQILDLQRADVPKAEKIAEQQLDQAKRNADLTVQMTDHLEAIQDGIFNYLFKALEGVLTSANNILSFITGTKKSVGSALEGKRNDSNTKLVDLLKGTTHGKEGKEATQAMLSSMDTALKKAFSSAKSDNEEDLIIQSAISSMDTLLPKSMGARESIFRDSSMPGDKGKREVVAKGIGEGKSLQEAMTDAKFTKDEIAAILKTALWSQAEKSASDVAAVLADTPIMQLASQSSTASPNLIPTSAQASARSKSGGSASTETAQSQASGRADPAPSGTSPGQSASVPPKVPGQQYVPGVTVPVSGGDEEILDLLDVNGAETVKSLQGLYNAIRRRGVVLDKNQLSGDFKAAVAGGTLDSLRTALAEYAMYSSDDPAKVLQNMKDSGLGAVVGQAESIEKAREEAGLPDLLKGNATGGMVTGIAGGRAVVAARGEGLASVGKGERISKAGGGSSSVVVNVNGIGGADLANLLQKKIAEGIYEYKRREKFQ